MVFDPFGIQGYHDQIRDRIDAGEPGFAQSILGEIMVSYEAASYLGPVFAYSPLGSGLPLHSSAILEEIILDVARGEGIASPTTFRRMRIERMIEDRQAYPPTFPKMRRQAEMLGAFYLEPDGEGAGLLF